MNFRSSRRYGVLGVAIFGFALAVAGSSADACEVCRVNQIRARSGLPQLAADPQLMALAQQKAHAMASRGITGHPGGSLGTARAEGVGWSSNNQFRTCFLYSGGFRAAGAATVRGPNGYHHVLLVR
ncbi:MAG: CAP domain-containing protein [Lacipirellulaceae bacterium]